ncbi:MAG: DUF3883 domain-containing protein [Rubrobacteraceae bacterium]|nr:DUF3883 domain-containing protein [Rubrobacteraceae bacterium]MCL6437452.1 DUF3883 domain-containing protein [Rubrobacteraceae bacterium]
MTRLEALCEGAVVEGIEYGGPVTVVGVEWMDDDVLELVYRDASGSLDKILLYRYNEPRIKLLSSTDGWVFRGDGDLFRLTNEAYRLGMAYLFDPYQAVHDSVIEALPHQISAVYERMLPQQPLRFLLADDPGAGKTIMAGLLMKELLARSSLERCLVCCPGNLAGQWQDELRQKFGLHFEIVARQQIEQSPGGNPYADRDFVIGRLDHMSRNESVQKLLRGTRWDLIVVDEAHKMSATYSGGEVSKTKRYRLGELLSGLSQNFLLLTATPHNGKEEDFQLFLRLLDRDRFEGYHVNRRPDVEDLMRRVIKEELRRFDGSRLFPPREALTVTYRLSAAEERLYEEVTEYVREEFNRAEALKRGRARTVGFALTVLQRRLASSPEAIYQSLVRRRERLEAKLEEERKKARRVTEVEQEPGLNELASKLREESDETTGEETEEAEEQLLDLATAALTLAELEEEIETLRYLERIAYRVRQGNLDRKWEELSKLLRDEPQMFDECGNRRKIIIFTEHRDTLKYLESRIRTLLGESGGVVSVTGGMTPQARKAAQTRFLEDPSVSVLIATDAAGEGINLQATNLMVNYDLPWNPNRLEQRFGRIHRIGQTKKCFLWNLIAENTREGDVYQTLLRKLERESRALGGRVFDVLGELFEETPLSELLVRAVREGESGQAPGKVKRELDKILSHKRLQSLLQREALAHEVLTVEQLFGMRKEVERARLRRLQPHYAASFFVEAFRRLGGRIEKREPGRFEILRVPDMVLSHARKLPGGRQVSERYPRITFDKDLRKVRGQHPAIYLSFGHPLLEAVVSLSLERFGDVMGKGAVLVDESDPGEEMRVLVCLKHVIRDGRKDRSGSHYTVSSRMQFVELYEDMSARDAGPAPYLDYRPATAEERALAEALSTFSGTVEGRAVNYAVTELVPRHVQEVKERVEERVAKIEKAVRKRLEAEISYWREEVIPYHKELKVLERHYSPANSAERRRVLQGHIYRANRHRRELEERLERRLQELRLERHLIPDRPVVVSAALIVPAGLLARQGGRGFSRSLAKEARRAVEAHERRLGYEPTDMSAKNPGYDIESRDPGSGAVRFIGVKAIAPGESSVRVTYNEIMTSLNDPENYLLAVVEVDENRTGEPLYINAPFTRMPDFCASAVTLDLRELKEKPVAGRSRTGATMEETGA